MTQKLERDIINIILENITNTDKQIREVCDFESDFYWNPSRTIVSIGTPLNTYTLLWILELIKYCDFGILIKLLDKPDALNYVHSIFLIEMYLVDNGYCTMDEARLTAYKYINELDIEAFKELLIFRTLLPKNH